MIIGQYIRRTNDIRNTFAGNNITDVCEFSHQCNEKSMQPLSYDGELIRWHFYSIENLCDNKMHTEND